MTLPTRTRSSLSNNSNNSSSSSFYHAATAAPRFFQVRIQRLASMMMMFLRQLWQWLHRVVSTWWYRWTGPVLTLDNGRQVRVEEQLAEGGFSLVFRATQLSSSSSDNDKASDDKKKKSSSSHGNHHDNQFALKRCYVAAEPELRHACGQEAQVHYAAAAGQRHAHLMPLLGFLNTPDYCYFLFPLYPTSLRTEVNRRTGIVVVNTGPTIHPNNTNTNTTSPWDSDEQVLHLFLRIASALHALHEDARYSHRDVKLENVLLRDRVPRPDNAWLPFDPVVMDFGSAGPLTQELTSRRDTLMAVELAAQQTTLPYRPPELLDAGGISTLWGGGGDNDATGTNILDYRAVDVWSLGCTLFATMYGASPMELEFRRDDGRPRITECTTLRILNPHLPRQQPKDKNNNHQKNAGRLSWYQDPHLILDTLVQPLLQQDPAARPTLPTVLQQVQELIQTRYGGSVPTDLWVTTTNTNTTTTNTTTTDSSFDFARRKDFLLEDRVNPNSSNSSNNKKKDDDDDDGFGQFYSSNV
mmetsp:Transcript_1192/g.3339  ORF Transcript_1192/g.3339 Transcript_1192/m.3339 type:complete len:526 (-) Transcript_1192:96-1673(-)